MPRAVFSEAMVAYYATHAAVTKVFSSSKIYKDTTAWRQCYSFSRCLHIPPDLYFIKEPVPFLQIIARKVLTGFLAVKNKAIKKLSVELYIRSVGQFFTVMGAPDL